MSNCGQAMPASPVHPCGFCGSHEGLLYEVLAFVRTCVIGLLILFLTAYLAYQIHTEGDLENLKNLEKEILEYKKQAGTRAKGEGKTGEDHFRGLSQCLQRNDAGKLDQKYIRRIVEEELSVFDLDKTGKTDYALGTMGGTVLSTPNTKQYSCETTMSFFGEPPGDKNGPESILHPSVHPGDCWAFAGRKGSVVVRLYAKIVVTDVALEHLAREVSPSGKISSAPKVFSVVGLATPSSTIVHSYGSFVYSDTGAYIQSFRVKDSGPPTQYVRFDFQDNHGNTAYTCVYRIRVHGTET